MYQTTNKTNFNLLSQAINSHYDNDADFRVAFNKAISKMSNIVERMMSYDMASKGSACYGRNPAQIFETKSLFNNDIIHDIEVTRKAFVVLNAETKKIMDTKENVIPYLANGKVEDTLSVCYNFIGFMAGRIPKQQDQLKSMLEVFEDLLSETAC